MYDIVPFQLNSLVLFSKLKYYTTVLKILSNQIVFVDESAQVYPITNCSSIQQRDDSVTVYEQP